MTFEYLKKCVNLKLHAVFWAKTVGKWLQVVPVLHHYRLSNAFLSYSISGKEQLLLYELTYVLLLFFFSFISLITKL